MKILVKLPILRSPGTVPIANNAITAIPIQKLPVPIAYICIAKVNPHGKKKVKAPVIRSFQRFPDSDFAVFISLFLNHFPVGKVKDIALNLGEILVKLIPSKSITIQMISVIIDITNGDTLITDPNNPRIPPKIPNPTILHTLSQR